jgi:hypothetical protein
MLRQYETSSSSTRSGIEFIVEISPVDYKQQINYSTILHMCQSIVAWKEKLEWLLCGSYNGIGNGHCVAIHHVTKCWQERLLPTFYSFMHLNITGR